MIRESLDQWDFVLGAYAVGVIGTSATAVWSWIAMKRAEAKRERSRER